MEGHFCISAKEKIAVYGGGERGVALKKDLVKIGYEVICYLDKNRNLKRDLPVYSIDECDLDLSTIIIISLSNGSVHKSIADELLSKGYNKIIFIPIDFFSKLNITKDMFKIYEKIVFGDSLEGIKIPKYDNFYKNMFEYEHSIIEKYDEYFKVWVDFQSIYSLDIKKWEDDKDKVFLEELYQNKNIGLLHNIISMMEVFEGKKTKNRGTYLKSISKNINIESLDQWMNEREKLYQTYNRELNFGMEFFENSAPLSKWNKKGYFNLLDGHHRVSFLYLKGFRFIPLKISKKDFNIWLNDNTLKCVLNYIQTEKFKIKAPISHPSFNLLKSECEDFCIRSIRAIFDELRGEDFKSARVLDISGYEGFFGRNIEKMTKEPAICVDDKIDFVKKINKLLYNDNMIIYKFEELKEISKYEFDIIIMMDIFNKLNEDKKDYIFKILKKKNNQKMFCSFELKCVETEKNIIFLKSNFSRYKKIFTSISNNIEYEFGFFY